MDHHAHVTWSSWQEALTDDWVSPFDQRPLSAQQEVLSTETGLYPWEIVYPQRLADSCAKTGYVVKRTKQVPEYDQLCHDKAGWHFHRQSQVLFYMPSPRDQLSGSQLQPLLGAMASLLDTIASDFVFGPMGTVGRPRGYITLYTICTMADDEDLDESQRHRWQQFLQVWETAGWGCSDIVLLTEELRPLQYGHPRVLAHCAEVDAKMMLKAISSYGNSQGHRRLKLEEGLNRFFDVIQQNFSSSRTVLICDPDVNTRLSKVKVTDDV